MTDNVYDKARQVLRERGRTTAQLIDVKTGRVCLIGAVKVAVKGTVVNSEDYRDPANRTLAATIVEQFPDRAYAPSTECDDDGYRDALTVYDFNDHRATTDADVDLVLDKAARAFDEQVQS